MTDMTTLGSASLLVRSERARVRCNLADGTLTLADVLTDPPPCLDSTPTFTVLTYQRRFGHQRLVEWNAEAVRKQMNLALPPARLSQRTREWLIEKEAGRVCNVRAERAARKKAAA